MWTYEMLNALRNQYELGDSYGKIAMRLQISRNAVAGKISRIGLPKRGKAGVRRPTEEHKMAPKKRQKLPVKAPKIAPPTILTTPMAPSSAPIPIMDLTPTTCRFPVDTAFKEQHYCGEYTLTQPYCECHRQIVYYRQATA